MPASSGPRWVSLRTASSTRARGWGVPTMPTIPHISARVPVHGGELHERAEHPGLDPAQVRQPVHARAVAEVVERAVAGAHLGTRPRAERAGSLERAGHPVPEM